MQCFNPGRCSAGIFLSSPGMGGGDPLTGEHVNEHVNENVSVSFLEDKCLLTVQEST